MSGYLRRFRLLVAGAALSCIAATGQADAQTNAGMTGEAVALFQSYKNAATVPERELAQYNLAVALYRLKLHHAAYGIFAEIADHPDHVRYAETLLWLGKLVSDLPEPADVTERIGKYEAQISTLDNARQREVFWQLNYLLGRYKYRNHQYDEAARRFSSVARESKYFLKAQFFLGIANVQRRRPTEAIQAFERIVRAIDSDPSLDGFEDTDRLRDLAILSIARTYYSTSVTFDQRGAPLIDQTRLAAAIKHWDAIPMGSELWLDALLEQSWGLFVARDHARALGNLHTVQLDVFPNAYHPEAELLRSVIYIANCQYDDAATLAARFQLKYEPIEKDLRTAFRPGEDQEEAFYRFLKDVRDGKANLPPRIKIVVENALGDRQLLRHLQYVQMLDDELKRFGKVDPVLRESALGNEVLDTIQLSRDIAVRNAGLLAMQRYQRVLAQLHEQLRYNAGLLDAALAGSRGTTLAEWRVPAREAERNVVKSDGDHVLWPFTGELWPDERPYLQSIRSGCR